MTLFLSTSSFLLLLCVSLPWTSRAMQIHINIPKTGLLQRKPSIPGKDSPTEESRATEKPRGSATLEENEIVSVYPTVSFLEPEVAYSISGTFQPASLPGWSVSVALEVGVQVSGADVVFKFKGEFSGTYDIKVIKWIVGFVGELEMKKSGGGAAWGLATKNTNTLLYEAAQGAFMVVLTSGWIKNPLHESFPLSHVKAELVKIQEELKKDGAVVKAVQAQGGAVRAAGDWLKGCIVNYKKAGLPDWLQIDETKLGTQEEHIVNFVAQVMLATDKHFLTEIGNNCLRGASVPTEAPAAGWCSACNVCGFADKTKIKQTEVSAAFIDRWLQHWMPEKVYNDQIKGKTNVLVESLICWPAGAQVRCDGNAFLQRLQIGACEMLKIGMGEVMFDKAKTTLDGDEMKRLMESMYPKFWPAAGVSKFDQQDIDHHVVTSIGLMALGYSGDDLTAAITALERNYDTIILQNKMNVEKALGRFTVGLSYEYKSPLDMVPKFFKNDKDKEELSLNFNIGVGARYLPNPATPYAIMLGGFGWKEFAAKVKVGFHPFFFTSDQIHNAIEFFEVEFKFKAELPAKFKEEMKKLGENFKKIMLPSFTDMIDKVSPDGWPTIGSITALVSFLKTSFTGTLLEAIFATVLAKFKPTKTALDPKKLDDFVKSSAGDKNCWVKVGYENKEWGMEIGQYSKKSAAADLPGVGKFEFGNEAKEGGVVFTWS